MKHLLKLALIIGLTSNLHAQTESGSWMIETGTSFNSINGLNIGATGTGFSLFSSDGSTIFSLGGEAGYFVQDDLAVKGGLGVGDLDGATFFSLRGGAKYYLNGNIPFQGDLTFQFGDDLFGDETPIYLGLQGGYAFFVGEKVSIEPAIRYNISLNDTFDGILSLKIGIGLFL